MQLDHVFVFTEPSAPERARLASLDLVETYRREHPGQGTANVCYAFDNAFLELLWLTSQEEAESEPIRRTRLAERACWSNAQPPTVAASPFGIAWRAEPNAPVATWSYRPPYLPDGGAIRVAVVSDDVHWPLCFESPATAAPSAWPAERRGALQRAAGWTRIRQLDLHTPGLPPADLVQLSELGLFTLTPRAPAHRLDVHLEGSGRAARLSLPSFDIAYE